MKSKVYAGMAAAAVALGLLYAFVEKSRASNHASSTGSAPFLPELATTINDVHTLRVQTKDKTFSISRGEKGWGMDEKQGYPVDSGKVRALLLALKDARPIEEKTDKPALYPELEVQEPDVPESPSKRVILLDGSGKELASLIIGKRRAAQGAGGMPPTGKMPADAYYVRKSGAAPSWLVEAKLEVEPEEGRWLDRTILNVDRTRVRAAEITGADSERIFVYKVSRDAPNFDVAGLPEGRELRYAGIANGFSSALSNLTLDDVVPAADVVFDDPPTAKTTFWTFDNMRIDVTLQERDEKLYAKVETSYDDAGATAAGAPVPPPPVEEPPAEVEGGDPEVAAALEATQPKPDPGPTPEEVQKEVGELGARASAWVYVLPTWKKTSFVKRMDELLKELPPPAEEAAPVPGEELVPPVDDSTTGSEDGVVEEIPPPADQPPVEEPKKDDGGTDDDGDGGR